MKDRDVSDGKKDADLVRCKRKRKRKLVIERKKLVMKRKKDEKEKG